MGDCTASGAAPFSISRVGTEGVAQPVGRGLVELRLLVLRQRAGRGPSGWVNDHEPGHFPFRGDDRLLELRDGAHPGDMLHVALLRLVQDAGLEGGFDQAAADHDVEATTCSGPGACRA